MISLNNTRLLGHRGARNEALENTFFGFQHAQSLQPYGLSGVEFDVQMTKDGHLVVFHDETLQRLCRLQSRIDQLSLVEIQRHLQSGHPIITLDKMAEVLSAPLLASIKPPMTLNIFTHIELEIKTHERTNHAKLVQALYHYLVDSPLASLPIVLTSFDTQLLSQLQHNHYLRHIPRGLLVRTPQLLTTAPQKALQLGCGSLGIDFALINQQVIDSCHRYGLKVSAWTVNDIEFIKQLVKWQVDVIITDIPSQLLIY